MSSTWAPKQWSVGKTEAIELRKLEEEYALYLSMDPNLAPIFAEGATWAKKTKTQLLRSFTDDNESAPEAKRLTAQ